MVRVHREADKPAGSVRRSRHRCDRTLFMYCGQERKAEQPCACRMSVDIAQILRQFQSEEFDRKGALDPTCAALSNLKGLLESLDCAGAPYPHHFSLGNAGWRPA